MSLCNSTKNPQLCIENIFEIREGKQKTKKLLNLSIRAGWLGSADDQNPTKKNIVFKKKYKDDQNGLIHP